MNTIILKIKQVFCGHSYRLCTNDVYMNSKDKNDSIKSTKIELRCMKCGKKIEIFDKHKYYLSRI